MVHLPSTPSHKKPMESHGRESFFTPPLSSSFKYNEMTIGVLPHRRGTRGTCSVNIALLRRQYEKLLTSARGQRRARPRDCKTEVRLSPVHCVQRAYAILYT